MKYYKENADKIKICPVCKKESLIVKDGLLCKCFWNKNNKREAKK